MPKDGNIWQMLFSCKFVPCHLTINTFRTENHQKKLEYWSHWVAPNRRRNWNKETAYCKYSFLHYAFIPPLPRLLIWISPQISQIILACLVNCKRCFICKETSCCHFDLLISYFNVNVEMREWRGGGGGVITLVLAFEAFKQVQVHMQSRLLFLKYFKAR